MQTELLQYYSNGDISLMKEFLLTIPVFSQIHHFLDNEKFYQFLKSIDVHSVFCSHPFQLNPASAYLFLSQGMLISNKEKRQNYHKLTRLSKTIKLTHIFLDRDTLNSQKPRESQALRTIEPNQLFNQPLFYNPHYVGEKLLFMSQHKKSSIIEINFSKIDFEIMELLRQKHNQKLKFILNLNLFKKVQKYLIESNLSKFKVLKVCFDECLMKQPNLRTNHLFFLTTGEVEVFLQNNEGKKSYVTKAPAILGLDRIRYVKSVTQYCLCYFIEKNEVTEILTRNLQSKYKNSETEDFLNKLSESIIPKTRENSPQNPSIMQTARCVEPSQEKQPRLERNPTVPILPDINTENQSDILKAKSNLFHNLTPRIPSSKKYRIKEHFPNFINGNLPTKRPDYVVKFDNDSAIIQMKSLQPKSPEMGQINKKLKMQRLNKLKKCKENIIQTKEHSLNEVNLRIYEQFQDSKIINKIRRKIQQDITKKQRINKSWRINVNNGVSFNKISDLCVGI